jgi:hypothetical protein
MLTDAARVALSPLTLCGLNGARHAILAEVGIELVAAMDSGRDVLVNVVAKERFLAIQLRMTRGAFRVVGKSVVARVADWTH